MGRKWSSPSIVASLELNERSLENLSLFCFLYPEEKYSSGVIVDPLKEKSDTVGERAH